MTKEHNGKEKKGAMEECNAEAEESKCYLMEEETERCWERQNKMK